MHPAFRFALLGFLLTLSTAHAGPVGGTLTGSDGLNDLGTYTGTFTYKANTPTSATLVVELKNTSLAGNGGFLTAFSFNNPENYITGVSLSSSDSDFGLLGGTTYQNGVNSSPFGQFDIGASTGGNWEGGGPPSKGIALNFTETFTFTFTGTNLNTLTEMDFFDTLSEGTGAGEGYEYFVARFRGYNTGAGSDKVPASFENSPPPPVVINKNPEPASLLLASIGAGCMFFHARRTRKLTVEG